MCGITGLWNVRLPRPATNVSVMLDAMRHRGPDGRGMLEFQGGAAGMVRLALVDLSERGQQPLWSPDRRVAILFNGEMYNFREERQRLEQTGCSFYSTTDTEVILHLYLERGLRFADHLRGMYAVAIFDWRSTAPGGLPVLVLARSPLGIKPLYIAQPAGEPEGVMFASEVRALLASELVPRRVDRQGLSDYLAHGFVLQPRTIIEGVRMLQPGTLERYAPGEPVYRTQFMGMPPYVPRAETLDQAAERLRSELEESVRLHALADAPIGAFLSGGVDSTGIVALMRKHVGDLRTYTVAFPDLPGHDEAQEAAAAAKVYECRHTMVELVGRDIAEAFPRFAGDLDQPSWDGFNTWLISRAAARDVKGVLSGIGGDEWFAGYPVTRRMAQHSTTPAGRASASMGQLAHWFGGFVRSESLRDRAFNLAARRSRLTIWIHSHTVFRYETARRLAGLAIEAGAQEAQFAAILAGIRSDWRKESAVGLSCLLDGHVYLIHQLLRDSDAASMAHSLELRVPLVDLEVLNFSRTCQDGFKLASRGGSGNQYVNSGSKRVLIHALRDVLPPNIVNRRKRGFALPYEQWMSGSLASIVEETNSPDVVSRRGLVDPALVSSLFQAARSGPPGSLFPRIWSLTILELWCRAVLDRH